MKSRGSQGEHSQWGGRRNLEGKSPKVDANGGKDWTDVWTFIIAFEWDLLAVICVLLKAPANPNVVNRRNEIRGEVIKTLSRGAEELKIIPNEGFWFWSFVSEVWCCHLNGLAVLTPFTAPSAGDPTTDDPIKECRVQRVGR